VIFPCYLGQEVKLHGAAETQEERTREQDKLKKSRRFFDRQFEVDAVRLLAESGKSVRKWQKTWA
jgi:hypothetical protein